MVYQATNRDWKLTTLCPTLDLDPSTSRIYAWIWESHLAKIVASYVCICMFSKFKIHVLYIPTYLLEHVFAILNLNEVSLIHKIAIA